MNLLFPLPRGTTQTCTLACRAWRWRIPQIQLCSASGSNTARQILSAKELIYYIWEQPMSICPVQALIDFIAVRSPEPGPIFVYQLATPLTRIKLVCEVLETLRQAGIPPTADTGQSFRIGAATTAAKRGMQDSLIQTLGRWKSAAYHARNLHP